MEGPADPTQVAQADLAGRSDHPGAPRIGWQLRRPAHQAELAYGRDIVASHNAIAHIMRELGLRGTPTRRLPWGARLGRPAGSDLVARMFRRERPNELWIADITEHPTREGKLYCAVVLDAFSRMVVGWAIDTTQTGTLVTDALGMALRRRGQHDGLVLHTDRGVQLTSWAFSQKIRNAGIAPSMGAVGSKLYQLSFSPATGVTINRFSLRRTR